MADEKWESFKLDHETAEKLRHLAKVINKPVGRLLVELLQEPLRIMAMVEGGKAQ